MAVLEGLLTGVGSLGASLGGAFIGQSMSKDMMDYQYRLQQKAIDAMNLYNSPGEQVKRLKSAGLSANLVYGSGVDGNQSTAASVNQSNRSVDMANPLGDAVVAYQQQKQLDQSIKESESREWLNTAKTLGVMSDNSWKDSTLDKRVEQENQRLLNMIAEGNYTTAKYNNALIQRDEIVANIQLLEAKTGLTQKQIISEACRPAEIRAHARLMREQANTNVKQRELYDSIIALNDKKLEQLQADIDYLLSRKEGQDLENELNKRMQSLGLQGASGKDLLMFVKDIILSFVRGK